MARCIEFFNLMFLGKKMKMLSIYPFSFPHMTNHLWNISTRLLVASLTLGYKVAGLILVWAMWCSNTFDISHTKGHISYYVTSKEEEDPAVFTGDTLVILTHLNLFV